MIFGFQLDIYEDFIYANNLIRKNIQSNKMSKYLVGKAIKMYIYQRILELEETLEMINPNFHSRQDYCL